MSPSAGSSSSFLAMRSSLGLPWWRSPWRWRRRRPRRFRGSASLLEALEFGTDTGAAFVAFGQRAVTLEYMSQQQLDTVAARLVGIEDPGEREAETVKAMRRFICTEQPLGESIRVEPNCKPFKNGRGTLSFDLNGMELSIDGTAPPGGDPERYNVLCEEDGDHCTLVLEIEPKHLRPCPMNDTYGRDENASPIPEDHQADEWWADIMKHHDECELMYKGMGERFGPCRPSGPGPQ